ncbi:MAG: right-handed parallel beta-helix repeat-containing protein [Candidatus Marinimicrobia bacterium]|nr:right-handed parallel beta-helix repeat-containing protein [Candidatus Neomarinimicrobiota bacterium]
MRINILILLSFLSSLTAQTQVSGSVSGTWTSTDSPYVLTADIIVLVGDTLTIEPSCLIELGMNHEFRIEGTLYADSSSFYHAGSIFSRGGHVRFNQCQFDYLTEGITFWQGIGLIENCTISNSESTGVSFYGSDSSFIKDSHITNSGNYGIKVSQTDLVVITGNTLTGNSRVDHNHPALFIDSCSPQVIENNIIDNNHGQGVGVWSLTSIAAPVLRGNFIRGNFTGITVVNSPAYILDNVIVANYQEGNFNSGAGIYAGYGSSVGIVMGNYIGGNYYGVSVINGASPNLGDMVNDYPGDDGLNLFDDNTFDGQTWHIWNGTSSPIMAQNNYWLGLDISEVDATLYDNEEGGGEIFFEPIYAAPLPEPPDINDDELVNILDVVVLIEGIIGLGIPDPVTFYLSDINHDFDINISDVTALIDIVVQ